MTGIIDIGSNTIRLVTFDRRRQISNVSVNSEIIADTENRLLTPSGIEKLCDAVKFLKERAGDMPVYAFATYAVRILKNCGEVHDAVLEKTGVDIDILSGVREAEYDFYGLKSYIHKNASGIGIDLGGGSAQIMLFRYGDPEFLNSYPIGCRRIKNEMVRGKFPDAAEKSKINEYVKSHIGRKGHKGKLYMMGGTAKKAAKIYSFLFGSENANMLKTENLPRLIEFIEQTPAEIMKKVMQNRYDNIVVGIVIMQAIAECYNKSKIYIKKCGVRDGYLMKICEESQENAQTT